jgi:hypothetical protein
LCKKTIGRKGFELPKHRDTPLIMVCTNLTYNSLKKNRVAYYLSEGLEKKLIDILFLYLEMEETLLIPLINL